MSEPKIRFQCWQDGHGDMDIIDKSFGNGDVDTPAKAAEWYVRRREQGSGYRETRPQIGRVICVYDGEKIYQYRLQLLLTPLSAHDPVKEPFMVVQSQRDGRGE